MFRVLIAVFSLVVGAVISGCAQHVEPVTLDNNQATFFQQGHMQGPDSRQLPQGLDYYVRQVVSELTLNMDDIDTAGVTAITHFVETDSNYQSTNKLGLALGEFFLKELHQFGFNTIDYKVADAVRVTAKGDFVLSRDFLELRDRVSIRYLLVGSLTKQQQGYAVNARLVDINSKAILATGQTFIPRQVANMLAHR